MWRWIRLTVLLLVALALGASRPAMSAALVPQGHSFEPAPSATSGPISVVNMWVRTSGSAMAVSAAYFEILNSGAEDRLLSIETPLADHVSMHATIDRDGVMEMSEMESVDVPARGSIVFTPGGRHAMLMGLKRPLSEGDKISMTLVFEHMGRVQVEATAFRQAPSPTKSAATSRFRLAVWPSAAPTPEFSLTDQEGRMRTLRDYRGKVVAVMFGFMQCPDVCPTQLLTLSIAVKQLGEAGKRIKVLFITLDPSRDTFPALEDFVTTFDTHFGALSGSVAQVDRTAADFKVQYARVADGDGYTIKHSTAVFVFDKRGRLRLLGGYSSTAEDYAEDLRTLETEK